MNWYYVENGQQKGPVTQDQLDELARLGTIKADSLVWTDGMANWLPYSQARPGSGAAPAAAVPGAAFAAPMPSGDSVTIAREMVKGPSIAMLVNGSLIAIVSLFGTLSHLLGKQQPMPALPPEVPPWVPQMIEAMQGPVGLAANVFSVLVGVFIIFGSLKMMKLQSRGLAMATAIVSMIPCLTGCCCVLGLPFGIWALVVLNKPEVKSSFR